MAIDAHRIANVTYARNGESKSDLFVSGHGAVIELTTPLQIIRLELDQAAELHTELLRLIVSRASGDY